MLQKAERESLSETQQKHRIFTLFRHFISEVKHPNDFSLASIHGNPLTFFLLNSSNKLVWFSKQFTM